MATCPRCATEVVPGARFCDACGTPVQATAPQPIAPTPGRPPVGVRPGPPPSPGTAATQKTTVSIVCAAFVAGIGVLFLIGALAPFVSFGDAGFGADFTLTEGNGALATAVVVAALLCVGACVGELLRLREALLLGAGLVSGIGAFAALTVASTLLLGEDLSISVGALAWILVALGAGASTIMLLTHVVGMSDNSTPPVVFPACALGGGIALTLALLIPPPNIAFRDHLSFDEPFVTVLTLLYVAIPTLGGVAAMVARHRSMHVVVLGVATWYALDWASNGIRTRDWFGASDLGGRFYLQALALLVFGLAAIGGGLVRWHGRSVSFGTARDYALPISSVSVFVIVLFAGLVG